MNTRCWNLIVECSERSHENVVGDMLWPCIKGRCINEEPFNHTCIKARIEEITFRPSSQFTFNIFVDVLFVIQVDLFWELFPVWSSLHVFEFIRDCSHCFCNLTTAGHCSVPKWFGLSHLFISYFSVSWDICLHCLIKVFGQIITFFKTFGNFFSFILRGDTEIPTCSKLCWGWVISFGTCKR